MVATNIPTSPDLLARWQANDPAAWREFTEEYGGVLYAVIRQFCRNHEDVEELVNDTLRKAHKAYPRFEGRCAFKTWLTSIARNSAFNRINWNRRRRVNMHLSLDCPISDEGPDTFSEVIPDGAPRVDTVIGVDELQSHVEVALLQLKPEWRELLLRRFRDHRTYEELAAEFGSNVGTIKSRLSRARQELRRHIPS